MTRAVEIRAPCGETEGTRSQILRWLKRLGESVAENEPLIEIETDKVTVELASPGSGVLREILKQEQEEIAPGELLGRIESGAAAGAAAVATPAIAAPAVVASAAGGSAGAPARRERRAGAAAGELSPAVSRLLRERGLGAPAIRGPGPGGRVTVEDVLRGGTAEPREPGAGADAAGEIRRVPHTAVRKRIAEHMVQSLLRTAPHVTTVFEADLAAVLADRSRRREEFARRGVPLTLTAYFVQAAVAAIRAVPEANSRWTDTALEIHEPIHIGVATAVEGTGLLVPVLRDAGSRDLFDTALGLNDLVTRARAGALSPADLRGGTFTISNHGVSGSLLAAPTTSNPPQSPILGAGNLEKRPGAVDEGDEEKIMVRPRCYVTLTLDHRVMDGHRANRFLEVLVHTLGAWPA